MNIELIKSLSRISNIFSFLGFTERGVYRCLVRSFSPSSNKSNFIVGRHRPFFVLSTGRTATMWLSNLLNTCSDAHVAHEPVPAEQIDHARAFMNPKVADEYIYKFRLRDMALRCQSYKISRYGEVNGALRRHASSIKKFLPDSCLIHLVRDGRDVVRSVMSRKTLTKADPIYRDLSPPEEDLDPVVWKNMNRFERLCWIWAYENAYLRSCCDFRARFEDITTEFSAFKEQILDPIGLDLSLREWALSSSTPINQTTGKQYKGWADWTETEKSTFIDLCGDEMAHYGYDLK